ncbi:MAG: valine--tRNA ligase, partial [Candidatus Pacebacteria bacterium]|nr:valine--tRNA ligase [Candidatus Paceibacterota bacterium]MBP9701348.1 valine--tRNA ligase [Candidatus Paceibacterota bacterium]
MEPSSPSAGSGQVPEKLLKPYNPVDEESRLYKKWEDSGYFNPEKCVDAGIARADDPFTIILPPPNVTGQLHMGHAMMLTIQDILIRYKRMQGFRTLWLPGTDHAAIATQSVVEKKIQKEEGMSRHDLGREEMMRRISDFATASHDTIVGQMKVMGASCDWSREAFTLDDKRSLAVRTVFKSMYDDELIYRGHRIVNWDPKGQTTISDDEIVYEPRKATMYTFKYSKDFPIAISTTRPETKVGDVAVAVHPDDARYTEYVGKEYNAEFCGVPIHIKVIADSAVEPEFGTGALGVTPAHSMTDWEIADRHNLSRPQVINEYAKMTVGDERLMGKKVLEARETIVAWLREEGLIEKEDVIDQNVATAERTGGIVEPLPKLQWFIDVNKPIAARGNKTLKELMRAPVADKQINIIPEFYDKTYFHWIDNLRDWCISRQIWYGHRIPVWYRGEEIYSGIEAPDGEGWAQDEDTLDTWFSSALWTFSTLGWPAQTEDLKIYHPTSVLETGPDILFFWVARMILMTQYCLDTIPFKTVYLHGLVRDPKGQKMSKSLGNALDPLEIANKYGADAGRMALIFGTAPGTDSKISEDKIKGQKHFANKIWNITRFVLSQENSGDIKPELKQEFDALAGSITRDLDAFRIHTAAETLYNYIWTRFADEILEESKKETGYGATLHYILKGSITLLHPFMP